MPHIPRLNHSFSMYGGIFPVISTRINLCRYNEKRTTHMIPSAPGLSLCSIQQAPFIWTFAFAVHPAHKKRPRVKRGRVFFGDRLGGVLGGRENILWGGRPEQICKPGSVAYGNLSWRQVALRALRHPSGPSDQRIHPNRCCIG